MGSNQGVSRARNAGADLMKSDWIVFLDDDAEAEPGWLEALAAPLGEPGVLGSSGTSTPIYDVPRPAWLPDEYLWAFGCSYLGLPTTTTRVRNFFGGAAAVDRDLFLELGGFSGEVGHHGTRVGGGEEVILCLEATRRTGGWFVFEPSAVAHHHLPASRLTWRYLVKRTYGEGRTKARLALLVEGEPLDDEKAFARRLPGAVVRYAVRPSTFMRAVGLVVASVAVLTGMAVERGLTRFRRR
jgi:glycosyltransferase involved in cell wall biosynthesis